MAKTCVMTLILALLFSCSKSDDSDSSGSDSDSDIDTDTDADTDSDSDSDTGPNEGECEALFGNPTENTGLTDEECIPSCECEGVSFSPPDYSKADIAAIAALELLVPFEELLTSPYEKPENYPA